MPGRLARAFLCQMELFAPLYIEAELDSQSDREGTFGMNILLKRVLDRLVRTGNLKVTGPKGTTFVFGDGSGEPVHMHIKTRHAERAITFDPMLAVPESYMDGEL